MTTTGERILIGVAIALIITLVISQIVWARGPGKPNPVPLTGSSTPVDADRVMIGENGLFC